MKYHIMSKELYPNGLLLEARGYSRNDNVVRLLLQCPLHDQ